MKAIKIASGVAIGALAAAISAQSFAMGHAGGAESTVTFSGDLRVQTVIDLENERQSHQMPGFNTPNEDWYNFTAVTGVTHGPFSGKLRIGIHEDQTDGLGSGSGSAGSGDNNGFVRVYDLRVDEGPVSFGQIGRITDSAGIYEDLTDETDIIGEDTGTRVGVDAALRYTLADFGLRVQAEGNGGHPFGFAASIHQDLGVAEVWADAQYRQATSAPATGMEDGQTTFGAAVKLNPIDMLSLTAVVRNSSEDLLDDTSYAAKAEVNITDTISVYGLIADPALDADDTTVMKVGASLGFAPITVSGSYESLVAEAGEGLVIAKVAYAQDAIDAYGEVKYNMEGFQNAADAGMRFELGAGYTTDSGIKYQAVYANSDENYWDGADVNSVTLRAQYSF